jgi:MFS family permease
MTEAVNPGIGPAATPAAAPEVMPYSKSYTRYAMFLLLGIYIVNFLDRQVINILAEPIKNDLGLADWQLGLMSGLAFAVFYTFLGIPIARMAERKNRPFIIGGAVAVWSGFTALCATAGNFYQLIAYRIGVGIGEAGCTPPAHSLIVDYTPKDKRASALAFYSMGTPIGGLLGLVMGGIVADAYGWRTAFLVAGAPGLIFSALAFFTLKEPRKVMASHAKNMVIASATFGQTMAYLLKRRTFWFIAFAAAIKAFIGYGHAPFTASFFLRNHTAEVAALAADFGLKSVGFLGLALGLISGTAGAIGAWTRLHGGAGHRQRGHHSGLHHRRQHRLGRHRPVHPGHQRLPGHALVRPSLRDRPVGGAAAHAGHRGGHPAVHHQPGRAGAGPAGRGHPVGLVQQRHGHGRGAGRALGADRLVAVRADRLRLLLAGA